MLIIFTRIFGLPMARRLVPAFFIVLLGLSQVDAITNWSLLREQLLSWPIDKLALIFSLSMAVWALAAGRAMGPCWQMPTVRLLKRQPISLIQWSLYLLPSLLIAVVPIAALWWLVPQHLPAPLHYLTAMFLTWPLVVSASFRGIPALIRFMGLWLAVCLGFFVYLGTSFGGLLPVAAICIIPFSLNPLWRQVDSETPRMRTRRNYRHPGLVMAFRDSSYLITQEKTSVVGHLFFALFLAVMMLALRINGELRDGQMFAAACIITGIFSISVYDLLEKIRLGLGKELYRIRWPVSEFQRLMALLIIGGNAILIMVIPVTLVGSTMALFLPLYLLFTITCLLMLIAIYCLRLRWQHSDHGAAVWALMLLLYTVTIATGPVIFACVSFLLCVLSFWLALQNLKVFAVTQEFG